MPASWFKQPKYYIYAVLGLIFCVSLAFAAVYVKSLVIFGGIAVIVLIGIISKHPHWGMYLLAFALPFERLGSIDIVNITVRPSQVLAIVTLCVWIARGFALNKFKLRPNPLFIPIIIFLCINSVGLLHTPNLSRSLLVLGFTLFTMIIAMTVPNLLRHPKQIQYCILAIIISCSLVSVFGIYQFLGDLAGLPTTVTGLRAQYTKGILGFPRVQSTALEPLYFANYLMIPLGVVLSMLLSKVALPSRWTKPVVLIAISVLAGVNLFLTVSRGGYIAFAVLIVFLAIIYYRTLFQPRTVLSILLIIAVIGFIGVRFINVTKQWDTFVQHVENIFGGASYSERIETFTLANRIWVQYPWFGIGAGGFGPYASYHPLLQPTEGYKIVNNEYVELLAETGVFGLVTFICMVVIVLLRSWKAMHTGQDPLLRAILIGLVAALLAVLAQYNTFSILYIMHIWFLFGLIIAAQNCLLYEKKV